MNVQAKDASALEGAMLAMGRSAREAAAQLREATSDQRWRDIAYVFATSSRLERGFWQMAYTLEQWPDLLEG